MRRFLPPWLRLLHLVLALVFYPMADPEAVHAAASARTAQAAEIQLPAPTGPHRVGRVTLHWTDPTRTESAPAPIGPRELMVDVWYPAADAPGKPAVYMDPAAFTSDAASDPLRGYLRQAYDRVRSGAVQTRAIESAPFARGLPRQPVLVFSHGGGEMREVYTAQLADLASHGYIVAAISHTFESGLVVFPGGRHARFVGDRWPTPTSPSMPPLPAREDLQPDRLRWWADDMRFVLSELSRASGQPFSGHIDVARAGAFGHSAGGEAAAQACQSDRRFKACLDQDGMAGMAPYILQPDGWGMDQPYMLIRREPPPTPPSDADLAAMHMSREEAETLLAKLRARQDRAVQQTGGGYRVSLTTEGTSHGDFGDLPILQASDAATAAARIRVMGTIRDVTRAFFDKTLRGAAAPLLDAEPTGEVVSKIERFPPAKRPRR
jgi:predicted dienelactone hydrolase